MSVRSKFARSFGIALLATSVLSCALVMSFADYDVSRSSPNAEPTVLYAVHGDVGGLEGADAGVKLSVNGAPGVWFGNGQFDLPIVSGSSYALGVEESPVHACSAAPAGGDVSTTSGPVHVECKSTDATLASVVVSGAIVERSIDPTRDEYTIAGSLLRTLIATPQLTAVTGSATATLSLSVGTTSFAPGVPHEISSALVMNGFDLTVTSRAGATKSYPFVAPRSSTYFKASNTKPGLTPSFGSAVALDGDTLAISAPTEDNAASGINGNQNAVGALTASGAVYIFRRTGRRWAQEAYVKSATPTPDALFGVSVALSGDTLVVGAYADPGAASVANAGVTYVFRRVGAAWKQEAALQALLPAKNARFGTSVAIHADTAIVGAPFDASGSGAAYVFRRSGDAWTQQARLSASNARPGASFGSSVAIDSDDAVVGASYESSSAVGVDQDQTNTDAPGAGAAYVFHRDAVTWTQRAYLKASNTRSGSRFGYSVALKGDTLVVGAPEEGSNGIGVDGSQNVMTSPFSGAAYLFHRDAAAWTQQGYFKAPQTLPGARFGVSVAVNGETLVAGAILDSAVGSGTAYVFHTTGSKWSPLTSVNAFNRRSGAFFGTAVALDGDALLVGSSGESSAATGVNGDGSATGATGLGAAYLY